MDSLPLFHRIAGQPVIVLGEGDAADAKRRLVERAGGIVSVDEDADARLAFVATDPPEAAAARLKARGVLINVPDRPELCDFTVPAILDRTPLVVAIATGGASAGLAKAVRLRLEQLLPQSLGTLAAALGAARGRLRAAWPDAGDRRRAIDAALGQGGPLDILRDNPPGALDSWLLGGDAGQAGGVVEIRLASSDPEELTLREARLLGSADVVAHESAVPEIILARARADAARVPIEAGSEATAGPGLTVILRI